MSDATARLALPFIAAGQAQKELFHNEALVRADALIQASVEAVALDDPPASPADGQCWIVGATPSGAWDGQALALAAWSDGGWRFVAPRIGMTAWSIADGVVARFDGAAWRLGEIAARRLVIGGKQVVGEQQSAIPDPAAGAVVDRRTRRNIRHIVDTSAPWPDRVVKFFCGTAKPNAK